jgi:hypothetical protein
VFPKTRFVTTYEVTLPTSKGAPYLPDPVPKYTLYPAKFVLVTGFQVSVAVVFELVDGGGLAGGGGLVDPDVWGGETVKVTGIDVPPALSDWTVTVAE